MLASAVQGSCFRPKLTLEVRRVPSRNPEAQTWGPPMQFLLGDADENIRALANPKPKRLVLIPGFEA